LQGIGRATALELASEQASGLALSDVDMEGLENTAKECKWTFVNALWNFIFTLKS